jgi:hypothetical protein
MAKEPKKPKPGALPLAQAIHAAMRANPAYETDDIPSETAGVTEPGAIFHVTDADGRVWCIRVYRDR